MARRDVELTKKIRDRVKKWDDDWRFNKDQYHEFMSFVMGSQWTEDESRLFIDYHKVPLTFNKLGPMANHLLGEQRQNTPNLQVVPDESVSVETAQIREALIKDISLNSHAKWVYQSAFLQSIIGGYGAFKLDTEYEGDDFNLVIVYRATKDPTTCYWDVSAASPCKTDGMFAGDRTRMSRNRFKQLYGEKIERQIGSDSNYDESSATGWIFSNDNEITIIDDYERKIEKEKIYHLSNGRIINKKEREELQKIEIDGKDYLMDGEDIVTIINDRIVYKSKIKHTKIAGEFVLEETDFPSEQLPIIFVDQSSYIDKSGKQLCRPFFKDARDAQRYINYLGTQSAYIMKVSRYDQFIVSKQNVRSPDTRVIWTDPATAQGGLIFDESPSGIVPQKLNPPELSQSLLSQYQRAMADIESSTGMYNTQMGEQGNEVSGRAIDARTKRGNKNTYVPYDSLNRAIAVSGEIVNEMIPLVYDSERMINLMIPDSGMQKIMLNQPQDIYGGQILNDMTTGKYKVRLLPGPSFEDQKMENLESIQTVIQADPETFRMLADLYVENLPMANNLEMRNRLKTLIPPEIIEAGKTGKPLPQKPQQPPPDVMLKMQELQMQQQNMQMQAQFKIKELQLKEQELILEGQKTGHDVSLSLQKLENERLDTAAKLKDQEMRFQAEMQKISSEMQQTHASNLTKILTHSTKGIENDRNRSNYH